MAAKQINVLYAVVATVASAAIAAYIAGSRIESPSDIAARTAPPTPSPILVPVEQRVLSSEIITRGTVRFGSPQPITIVPSALKGANGLITSVPLRSRQFDEGDVLLSESGRPVFLYRGEVPTYRDLGPGSSGQDVRQLKEALKRLGHNPGPIDGAFDEQTGAAVAQLYAAKGWEAFGPTRDQLSAVRSLERDRDDALRARMAALTALTSARPAVASARATSDQSVLAASSELAARTDDWRRLGDPRRNGKSLAVESEAAKAAFADRAAAADLEAQIAERALVALDPRQPEAARMAADAKLEVARAARYRTRLEGELAVQTAEREAALAAEKVKVAEAAVRAARLEGDKTVRGAIDTQRLAEFDLESATARANALSVELDSAKRRLGVQVPADEIVFVRALPVRIEEVTATVGANAIGSVMSVTDNQLLVESSLPLETAPLVKQGMSVSIDEQTLGIRARGTVRSVASSPGTRGVDGSHVFFDVLLDKTAVKLESLSVRLAIPTESTNGIVTVVPVSAISLSADGTSRVQVDQNGTLNYMVVEVGLSVGGFAEVAAVDGTLAAGQLVVVGYKVPDNREAK